MREINLEKNRSGSVHASAYTNATFCRARVMTV